MPDGPHMTSKRYVKPGQPQTESWPATDNSEDIQRTERKNFTFTFSFLSNTIIIKTVQSLE